MKRKISENDATAGQGDKRRSRPVLPINHSATKNLDPVNVHTFMTERERYGTELGEKKKEAASLSRDGYLTSSDPGLPKEVNFLTVIENINLEKITVF